MLMPLLSLSMTDAAQAVRLTPEMLMHVKVKQVCALWTTDLQGISTLLGRIWAQGQEEGALGAVTFERVDIDGCVVGSRQQSLSGVTCKMTPLLCVPA